jgi:hypothetical protein
MDRSRNEKPGRLLTTIANSSFAAFRSIRGRTRHLCRDWAMHYSFTLMTTLLAACAVQTQPDYTSPQSVLNSLIRQQTERQVAEDANKQRQAALRQSYRSLSNEQLVSEFDRYCPSVSPLCDKLTQEAVDRGLMTPTPRKPLAPGVDCVSLGDGEGGAITDCDVR